MDVMETSGSGEFMGTSIRVMPASTMAVAISTASSGLMPRNIAMRFRVMRSP